MVSEKEIKETREQIERCNDRELLETLAFMSTIQFNQLQEEIWALRQEIWAIAKVVGVEREGDAISYSNSGLKSISREIWTLAKALGVELDGDVQGNIVSYSPPKDEYLERLEREEIERKNEELTNRVNELERKQRNFVKKSPPENYIISLRKDSKEKKHRR